MKPPSISHPVRIFLLAAVLISGIACQASGDIVPQSPEPPTTPPTQPNEQPIRTATDAASQPSLIPTDAPTPQPSISPTPTPTTIPPASDVEINLAWFHKPPEVAPSVLASNFSLFILTHKDEEYRDELKRLGVKGPILQYLLLDEVKDMGSCTTPPFNNNVAYQTGDYCRLQQEHDDWFLHNREGGYINDPIYHTSMMDPANSQWRAFWLSRAIDLQDQFGWEGMYLDNVEASLEKIQLKGSLSPLYPDDASYQAAVLSFLKEIYTTYFQPRKRPVYANIISIKDPEVPLRYLQYLDGAMLENFAVSWTNSEGLSPQEWEQQMWWVTQAQRMGKSVILVAQGNQNDEQRQVYAFASYLLANEGRATFRYADDNDYDKVWLYPNYKIKLGQPLGTYYPQGRVWKRDFTKGTVEVDPLNLKAVISVH